VNGQADAYLPPTKPKQSLVAGIQHLDRNGVGGQPQLGKTLGEGFFDSRRNDL
jgi:hypothetical protein